jgi:hypothetical protein
VLALKAKGAAPATQKSPVLSSGAAEEKPIPKAAASKPAKKAAPADKPSKPAAKKTAKKTEKKA